MVGRALLVIVIGATSACGLIVGIPGGRHLASEDADAIVDSGSFAEGGHGFCSGVAPAPLLCDDFDEGPLSADWTKQSPASGSVAVDSTRAQSPPSSLHVSIADGGEPAAQVAYAARTFSATPSRAETAFAFWPDTLVPDDGANFVATLQFAQNTLTLYINPGRSAWQEHVEQPDGALTFPPDHIIDGGLSTTSWTDVDAVVDFTQTPAHLTVKYGGAQVLDTPLDPSWTAAPWSLTLGAVFLNNTIDARSFHYDNVVVWTQP